MRYENSEEQKGTSGFKCYDLYSHGATKLKSL